MTTNGRIMTKTPAAQTALDHTLADLRRRFGDAAITTASDAPPVRVIPTGFPALDEALGVGGLPCGRIVDIYGPESSGKTTLCWHIIAEAQAAGQVAVFIDTEQALDADYAANCGVDVAACYIAQPDTGEIALEIAEAMIRAGAGVVVIDSAAGLIPRAEVDGEMGDNHAGLQARLMSQALRKLAGPVRANGALLIFTNQLRTTGGQSLGDVPTGGMALRFHASVVIDLRRIRVIKSNGDVIGSRIRASVKKNKVAPPFKQAEFELYFE